MVTDVNGWFAVQKKRCQYCETGNVCTYAAKVPCKAVNCLFVKLLKQTENGSNRERNNGNDRQRRDLQTANLIKIAL
jgi:hypothetical protein